MAESNHSSSKTILHNSIWYGLETAIEIVVAFGTSIAVARYLGPTKLGHFIYINFFVQIFTRTAGQGVALATRKYMMEFLAEGRPGVARAVYQLASRYQLFSAVAVAVPGTAMVWFFGEHSYRVMSAILVVSLLPGLMSWVPAQANAALEDLRPNTLSALGYLATYSGVIVLTVVFHWDLVGVASATFVGRTVEYLLRIGPITRKIRAMPLEPLDAEIVRRIRRFSVQGLWLQLLTTVVWDRSELVFLKYLSNADQIAFYSVSFTFTSNLLTAARVFASTASINLMGEATRNYERVRTITWNACRFLLLLTVPITLGAAAVTLSAIHLAYDRRYLPAVPVLITASLLGIPRAFQVLPETLLRAADRQNRILWWYCVTGVVNIAVDWILIRRYAALGAAWGNGLAQAFGVLVIWMAASRIFKLRFPWGSTVRIGTASLLMAVPPYWISHRFPNWLGLGAAVLSGLVVYPFSLRLMGALGPQDRDNLDLIAGRLPGRAVPLAQSLTRFVTST